MSTIIAALLVTLLILTLSRFVMISYPRGGPLCAQSILGTVEKMCSLWGYSILRKERRRKGKEKGNNCENCSCSLRSTLGSKFSRLYANTKINKDFSGQEVKFKGFLILHEPCSYLHNPGPEIENNIIVGAYYSMKQTNKQTNTPNKIGVSFLHCCYPGLWHLNIIHTRLVVI